MKVYLAGIMVANVMSNKPDGKERSVKEGNVRSREECGRFLSDGRNRSAQKKKMGWCLTVILLLVWDGLLLYMIADCLIEPVYGAAFVAVVSVYFGNKL